jgi:hypothetical protein
VTIGRSSDFPLGRLGIRLMTATEEECRSADASVVPVTFLWEDWGLG